MVKKIVLKTLKWGAVTLVLTEVGSMAGNAMNLANLSNNDLLTIEEDELISALEDSVQALKNNKKYYAALKVKATGGLMKMFLSDREVFEKSIERALF